MYIVTVESDPVVDESVKIWGDLLGNGGGWKGVEGGGGREARVSEGRRTVVGRKHWRHGIVDGTSMRAVLERLASRYCGWYMRE